jgi:FMN phosphatase YigB (HAD superfamily)
MQELNHTPGTVLCKPARRAYEAVLERLGVDDARRVVFVDDSPKNVAAAHALGIFTVLIGRDHVPGADLVIPDVRELPRVLPALFAPATPPAAEHAEPTAVAVPIVVPA